MTRELDFLSRRVILGQMRRRDFLGRAAALGMTATMANTLLVGAARAQEPVRGGVLKIGLQGGASTDSLDPATWLSSVMFVFGRQWGEQLVELSPEGKLLPVLAEEWSSTPDAKEWTFKIRKGVQFHNGQEMTPADVLATLERHADEKSQSGALGVLTGISGLTVKGDSVVITLTEPNADMPYLMDDYHLKIQPNGGKDDPTAGIGTGPYKVVVNEPGIRYVGEKYENYWREDRGFADQIDVTVINDATARMAALQSGQVHMINRVEPKIVELIKRVPGVTVQNVAGRGHYVFIMHCNTAPFDNNDLRLALKYAINREEMVEKILLGYGSIGNDTPVNQAYPLFAPLEQRTFDPERAADHYKKSGHEGPILLRTSDVAFPGAVDATQLFQQSAAQAGITLEIQREPADGYWSEVWNAKPFCASYWGGRPTQDQMYTTAYYSKADWNDTRFFRDDFDQMLIAARGELDETKRKQMYTDMSQIVHDEGGVITPMFNDWVEATGPQVGGWVPDGNHEMMGGYAPQKCWINA